MVKQFPLEFHLNGTSILWIYPSIIWTLVLSCTLCMGSEFDVPTFWTWILAGVHRDYPLVTLESSHCPICAPLCSFHCSWPYSRHCKIFVRRTSHNVGILMLLLVVTICPCLEDISFKVFLRIFGDIELSPLILHISSLLQFEFLLELHLFSLPFSLLDNTLRKLIHTRARFILKESKIKVINIFHSS